MIRYFCDICEKELKASERVFSMRIEQKVHPSYEPGDIYPSTDRPLAVHVEGGIKYPSFPVPYPMTCSQCAAAVMGTILSRVVDAVTARKRS